MCGYAGGRELEWNGDQYVLGVGGRLFSTKIIRYTNNDRIRRITFS